MSYNHNNYNNWKSYYKDSQVEDFNIRNTSNIILFNTNDNDMPGNHQLNYLNKYLGELPMMYYVWKNNIYSDYVIISQYQRDFSKVYFNELDKDKIQVLYWWKENDTTLSNKLLLQFGDNINHDVDNFYKEKLFTYIKDFFNITDEDLNDKLNSNNYEQIACLVYACNWKQYCKLCEFIFGYLDIILPNDSWKNIDEIIKFRDNRYEIYKQNFKAFEEWEWSIFVDDRYIVFIMEIILRDIIPLFFDCFSNNEYEFNTYISTCINNDNEIDEANVIDIISKFYRKNLKTCANNIYVLFENENLYNICYKHFIEDGTTNWRFKKIKFLHKEDTGCLPDNVITINYDEYIDFDSIDAFYENKYRIKKDLVY